MKFFSALIMTAMLMVGSMAWANESSLPATPGQTAQDFINFINSRLEGKIVRDMKFVTSRIFRHKGEVMFGILLEAQTQGLKAHIEQDKDGFVDGFIVSFVNGLAPEVRADMKTHFTHIVVNVMWAGTGNQIAVKKRNLH